MANGTPPERAALLTSHNLARSWNILDDHAPTVGVSLMDITGAVVGNIPNLRNIVILEVWDPDGSYLDALQADANYAKRILTRESTRPLSGNITAGEFTVLNNYLLAQGFTQPQITGVIGAAPAGRTRMQVLGLLVQAFRALAHA